MWAKRWQRVNISYLLSILTCRAIIFSNKILSFERILYFFYRGKSWLRINFVTYCGCSHSGAVNINGVVEHLRHLRGNFALKCKRQSKRDQTRRFLECWIAKKKLRKLREIRYLGWWKLHNWIKILAHWLTIDPFTMMTSRNIRNFVRERRAWLRLLSTSASQRQHLSHQTCQLLKIGSELRYVLIFY